MNQTPQASFFLGIDAGGSKTTAVIVDQQGKVHGQGESLGANPHNMAIQQAWQHINEAVARAKHSVANLDGQLVRACLGLAGMDTAKDKVELQLFLKNQSLYDQTFGSGQLLVANDALVGLYSGTTATQAVCVIAGTGSHVFGINQGKTASSGCWGYLLGDQGSGFAFGQQILRWVLAEYDGRRQASPLTQAVLKELQLESVEDLLPWAYRGVLPVRSVAGLSKLLDQEALEPLLHPLVNQVATALLEAFSVVFKRLELESQQALPVVLIGGLFDQAIFEDLFIQGIRQVSPQVEIIRPSQPPVFGALALAQTNFTTLALPENALLLHR